VVTNCRRRRSLVGMMRNVPPPPLYLGPTVLLQSRLSHGRNLSASTRARGGRPFLPTLRQKSFARGAEIKRRSLGVLLVRDAECCFADTGNDLARAPMLFAAIETKSATIYAAQCFYLFSWMVSESLLLYVCPSMPNQSKQVVTQSLVSRKSSVIKLVTSALC